MSTLVLLDVDEAIIDKQYRLPIDKTDFVQALARAKECEVVIGLNSDSALHTLNTIHRAYGLNGPILAEKGALISFGAGETPIYVNKRAQGFRKIRDGLVQNLIQENDINNRYLVLSGDVNNLVNTLPPGSPSPGLSRVAIFVNGLRTCSLGCWAREQLEGGSWGITPASLQELVEQIEEIGSRFPLLWKQKDMDRNDHYGICIVHDDATHKSRAVDHLLRERSFKKIFMVGDSMSDWLDDPRVIQCAVGNAKADYKERCSIVAQSDRAAGVMEILEQL